MNGVAVNNKPGHESDGEEFSDTYDLVSENDTLPARSKLKNSSIIISARGEAEITGSQDRLNQQQQQANNNNNSSASSNRSRQRGSGGRHIIQGTGIHIPGGLGAAGGAGGGDGGNSLLRDQNDINHHLAMTIINLQQSVESISNRLITLEARINQAGPVSTRSVVNGRSSTNKWWPFNSPTSSIIFFLTYPIVAYMVIDRLKRRNAK